MLRPSENLKLFTGDTQISPPDVSTGKVRGHCMRSLSGQSTPRDLQKILRCSLEMFLMKQMVEL